jgi:3-phenylpropionate/trans-cinnamate dioxygenase ferredoxin subunit
MSSGIPGHRDARLGVPRLRACALADLAEGSALGVELDVPGQAEPTPVCVALTGGRVYALRDECSHQDVRLSDGEVEDGKIECWLHGSQFDLESGRPASLPAVDAVPTYPVTIEGGDVYVDLVSQRAAGGAKEERFSTFSGPAAANLK